MDSGSRILLRLDKDAIGRRLAMDILSQEGSVLVKAGTVLDDAAIEKLKSKNVSIVLIEPPVEGKKTSRLEGMFGRHRGDPIMDKLYEAAVRLTAHRPQE